MSFLRIYNSRDKKRVSVIGYDPDKDVYFLSLKEDGKSERVLEFFNYSSINKYILDAAESFVQ